MFINLANVTIHTKKFIILCSKIYKSIFKYSACFHVGTSSLSCSNKAILKAYYPILQFGFMTSPLFNTP